jgi:KDO2-lipid IV(A) lauroyltransferase
MGRGVVFATAHLGNFELMAAWLASSGYPIHTIARKSYEPRITKLLDEKRRACGVSCVYRNEPGAAAAMLRVLRRGEVLGLLMDQDTRVPSVFVPFFGKSASTPKGAAALARATGAAAVVGTIHRTSRGNHVIDIARQELPADEWRATALLTAALEGRIRRHPADWLWLHERWKTLESTEVLT